MIKRSVSICLAVGMAISLLVCAPTVASAAPAGDGRTATISAARQKAAVAFWTPQRLAAAKDAGAVEPTGRSMAAPHERRPLHSSAVPAARAKPLVGAPHEARLDSTTPQAWGSGGLISTTAGKIFFSNNSGTYTCSGDAVNSGNRSIVATAGHCVVDANTGEVYQNWVFIPGYQNGSRPFGTFTASSLHWMSQRIGNPDPTWDAAFATVSPVNGRSLVDTVGGEGIGFDQGPGQYVYSFGYGGSTTEGNGERLNWCAGNEVFEAGHPGGGIWGIDCIQTGGSSGGAFLQNFDTATGVGMQIGNISVSGSGREWHPYYGWEAHDAYNSADTA